MAAKDAGYLAMTTCGMETYVEAANPRLGWRQH
jgi:hypothetical protein